MIFIVFKTFSVANYRAIWRWQDGADSEVFLRSEILGCVINCLWASALFGLYCSVSVSEREVKVLIISY